MQSRILAFIRPAEKSSDWTRDELAELYRIENALIQSRVVVDVDRGMTDEGDPWFVFCRADGDVLVHISRIDGEYLLYSLGLPKPLRGKSFQAMSRSFVDQIPVQLPLQNRQGAQLFVHPASMLAVVIGTIFIAWDDARFISASKSAEGWSDDIGERSSTKASWQAAFHSYIESLLGIGREQLPAQHSSFLTLVSTIAAFAIGTSVLSEQTPVVRTENDEGAGNAVAAAGAVSVFDSGSDLLAERFAWELNAPRAATAPALAANSAEGDDTYQLVATGPIGELRSYDVPAASQPGTPMPLLSGEDARSEDHQPEPILPGLQVARTLIIPVEKTENSEVAGEPVKSSGSLVVAQSEFPLLDRSISIDQFLHTVKMEIPTLTVMSADQALPYLQHWPVVSSTTDSSVSSPVLSTASSATVGEPTLASIPDDLPLFDAIAADIINDFLAANKDAKLIMASQAVIFYDGHQELDKVRDLTYQAWESESGTMIAIVGHATAVTGQELLV